MNKYWAFYKTTLQSSFTYRASTIMWSIGELSDTLVFLFVWIIIFGEGQRIGGFSLSETITYLIGIGLINSFITCYVHYDLEDDIQHGSMSGFLLKPILYPLAKLVSGISEKPLSLVIKFAVYMFIILLYSNKFYINSDIFRWFLVLVITFLAFFLNYLTWFCLGCLSFWFTVNRGFSYIFQTVTAFFAGGYAPLTFFPTIIQSVANILPFSYTRYFPMLVYLNKVSGFEIIKGLGIQIFWIILLYFLARFLWKKGIKRYEGVGI